MVIGWAQTRSKWSNRFPEQVMSFLLEQFMIGKESGRKVTQQKLQPGCVHYAGNWLFEKGEWLRVQQVTSYFLRLPQLPTAVESHEEDVEVVVQSAGNNLKHAYFVNYWMPM